MTEELDSQLSAMFDDELPHSECELLARRLARDEALRQRWGRYAALRACLREEGSAGSIRIAARVRARLLVETEIEGGQVAVARGTRFGNRNLWKPVAGFAVACGVAAVSILWVRSHSQDATDYLAAAPPPAIQVPAGTLAASVAPVAALPVPASDASSEPDSYVVPAATESSAFAPTTELANYVVAHSEYSTPLSRRSLLSSFVGSESAAPVSVPVSAPAPEAPAARPNADR